MRQASFVLWLVLALSLSSFVFASLSKRAIAPILGILLISFGMFAYAIAPVFGPAGNDLYWFKVMPPPKAVSRITTVAILAICALMLWRGRRLLLRRPRRWLTAVAILAAPLILTLPQLAGLNEAQPERALLQFKFAAFLSVFLLVAAATATVPPRSYGEKLDGAGRAVVLILLAPVIVAFFEVALGVGPVSNIVHGVVEIRASSTFHNPNWFALSIAPGLFVACKLAAERRRLSAVALFGACALALILSGSRSAILLACLAIVILCIALWRSDNARVVAAILKTGTVGAAFGACTGFLAARLVGGSANSNYWALLDRVFFWPIQMWSGDERPWQSIRGRMGMDINGPAGPNEYNVLRGSGVVDNAYIYWLQENTVAGIALVILMVSVLAFAIRRFSRSRTFDDALRVSVAAFVVGGGLLGQVYWAFPVWPVFGLMLGYVLQPLARDAVFDDPNEPASRKP
jgi:hypothetical protein